MNFHRQNKTPILIVVSWCIFTLAAFTLFNFQRLQFFDPKGKVKNMTTSQFEKRLVKVLPVKMPKTLVHFSQTDCECNKASQRHIEQLNKSARENLYHIENIEIKASSFIPSTPSIAIIDEFGSLAYFGPYGEGLDCAQTNGFAFTVFNNLLQGFSSELIVELAQGCYCNT